MADSTAVAVNWVEQGLAPDRVIRLSIRRLLKARLAELKSGDAVAVAELTQSFVDELRSAPLALPPEKANGQHYEVPAAFFGAVLGSHRRAAKASHEARADRSAALHGRLVRGREHPDHPRKRGAYNAKDGDTLASHGTQGYDTAKIQRVLQASGA